MQYPIIGSRRNSVVFNFTNFNFMEYSACDPEGAGDYCPADCEQHRLKVFPHTYHPVAVYVVLRLLKAMEESEMPRFFILQALQDQK
jgi:hypothetical protein